MRATRICFFKSDSKPSDSFLNSLCTRIVMQAGKAGFITDASKLNGSSIKIGLHMSCFRINTTKLGYNARISDYVKSPKGYKRTDVPTWDQRVEFNNLINEIFDLYGLIANIRSGDFIIRNKSESKTENDWDSTDSNRGVVYNGIGQLCCRIIPEKDAREEYNSDELEREYAEKMRPIRLQKARERRLMLKQFRSTKKVVLMGLYGYTPTRHENGDLISHTQLSVLLKRLGKWESKTVREKTIEATLKEVSECVPF